MVGFGTALAGYGAAQPEIQTMQAQQRQKAQEAAMANVLKQYAARQQGGGSMPQGAPGMPQQGPVGAGTPPAGGAGAPGMAPPTQSGFSGGLPPLDQMITMLSSSGLPADQQYEALKQYGAFASPFEKMQQQMDMKQNQLRFQSDMLGERLQSMRDIANLRASTQERGQDIGAGNVDRRIAATERGQDVRARTAEGAQDIARQRADTYQQGTAGRLLQGEEGLKIKQQSADTAADRAGTYKYGTVKGAQIKQQQADTATKREASQEKLGQEKIDLSTKSLKEKNDLIARGQDKQYQAKLASIAARGTPQQQAAFKTAQSEFTQASSNYRNSKISQNSTMEDVKAMADKAALAQQKMEDAAAQVGSGAGGGKAATQIKTDAEYDALPPGTPFIDPEGVQRVKP